MGMDFEPEKMTLAVEAQPASQVSATAADDGEGAAVALPALADDALNETLAGEAAEARESVAKAADAAANGAGEGRPLAPGALINDRYAVLSCLDNDVQRYLYAVKPTRGFRCWSCGYEDLSDAADSALFCEECGAALNTQPLYLLDEPDEVGQAGGASPAGFALDQRRYRFVQSDHLEADADDTDDDTAALPRSRFVKGVRMTVGAASDNGMERDLDEDSVLTLQVETLFEGRRRTLGVFALADGMGGYEGGEIASRLAIQAIADVVATRLAVPWLRGEGQLRREDAEAVLAEAVRVAHQRVREMAVRLANQMGTTVTMALVVEEAAYIANVGDSRTYYLGPAGLTRITEDHSLVESLVARGVLQRDEVFSHPDRNVILRVVGDRDQAEVEADVFVQPLVPGSYLMLCCDGVWEMIQDPNMMARIIQQGDNPQAVCEELVRQANQAGGEDNISVIIVKIE